MKGISNRISGLFKDVAEYVDNSPFFSPQYAWLDAALVVLTIAILNMK